MLLQYFYGEKVVNCMIFERMKLVKLTLGVGKGGRVDKLQVGNII